MKSEHRRTLAKNEKAQTAQAQAWKQPKHYKDGIVYGFQVSNSSPDLMPCKGRHQPSGCYTIEFAFPDFIANSEPKKTGEYLEQKEVNLENGEHKYAAVE